MSTVKSGRFRLLLNFAMHLFRRKPAQVTFVVEWEEVPFSWQVDWYRLPDRVDSDYVDDSPEGASKRPLWSRPHPGYTVGRPVPRRALPPDDFFK